MYTGIVPEGFDKSKYRQPSFIGQVIGKVDAVDVTSHLYAVFFITDARNPAWQWRISLPYDFAQKLKLFDVQIGRYVYFEVIQHGKPYVNTGFLLDGTNY